MPRFPIEREISEQDRQLNRGIKEGAVSGAHANEIAKNLGTTPATVRGRAKTMSIQLPRQKRVQPEKFIDLPPLPEVDGWEQPVGYDPFQPREEGRQTHTSGISGFNKVIKDYDG